MRLHLAFGMTILFTAATAAAPALLHAHNDYEHSRPLFDALEHGFSSVEADIHLSNGQLLVAHDQNQTKPERTLENLYLDPLRARAQANGGKILPAGSTFYLLIDVKSRAEETWGVLAEVLSRYQDILTQFSGAGVHEKTVTAIISGNRARETMKKAMVRFAAFDGRLDDLESSDNPAFIPLISADWKKTFTWLGVGPMPPEEKQKLRGLVIQAHGQQRKLRFWGTPDLPAVWQELIAAKLDFINADDLEGLTRFIARQPQNLIDPLSAPWLAWSPRPEIAPVFDRDPGSGRDGQTALKISFGENPSAFGAWRTRIQGITASNNYCLRLYYRASQVSYEHRSVGVRVEWLDRKGHTIRPPEFGIPGERENQWTRVELFTTAPEGADTVQVDLSGGWAPRGTIWWSDVQLVPMVKNSRTIKTAAIFHRPHGKTPTQNVSDFCRQLDALSAGELDIVCLPEGITVVGTGKSYADVSESVPGPTTAQLGDVARRLNSYLVAGLYEREGKTIYNTAVLMDREGQVTGRYRKTHLPREEAEAGLTPGNSYPVFTTDFGKVGLLICWDVHFPEPARALAAQGAEIILLPIWGGNETLARARAIENHIFLITSSYDMKTFIVDPTGKILSEATAARPLAITALNLDEPLFEPWLGDMKNRIWKERRPDIAVP